MKLKGKRAVVTGGGSGYGKGIAAALAAAGAKVWITGRVCAQHAWPGWSVYTAAKAGLLKFSHGLHVELRPFGVKVTCLIPSWGQTLFNRAVGIVGASEDKSLAKKCIAPEELGAIIRGILEQPDHLTVPELTVQPMIQDINPM